MEFEGRVRAAARLDIAPVVDVVFLLLLFFLLTSTYVARSAISVRLPEADASDPVPSRALTVTLAADGRLWLDGEPITRDALARTLDERRKETFEPLEAVIEADAEADVAALVATVDLVRQAEIDSVAIRTRVRGRSP